MKNNSVKEFEIKIEGKKWEEALDKAFVKANEKVKIDGFRPGKAPKEVFLKKYGKESLYLDAADLSVQDAYEILLNDIKDLEIVAQPSVNIKDLGEEGVTYVFTITTKPEVKLGKYKGLDVKKEEVVVTDEEVEAALKTTLERYAEEVTKDGEVEKGDVAVIDFEGFKDGVPFDGGKGENYPLEIGSNTFIPGFEDQLIGMKKGEEKEINVKFPEDYHSESLKGADAVFKVKVNEIKTTKIPELNEEFFEDLGLEGINSKETLEAQLRENLQTQKEVQVENKYIDDLLIEAAKNTEVDIPEVMIEEEIHRMMHQYEDNLKMQGLSLELYYQFTNSNEEQLKNQMREEATNRVKYRLMLEEIAKAENIEITDEKADEEASKLAEKYRMDKEEFLNAFGGIEMIKYDLKMRSAMEVLKG